MAQAVFQDAQLLVSGGHVAVAELRIEHRALLRPPAVQRLIRLELLVAKQRLALVRLDQRRVHVQRRRGRGLTLLQKVQQRLVHPPETAQFLRHRRINAIPATALGEAGSSNRSSQPDSADGEGVARSRSRRQRLFSNRRSARESKSFSIARRIAEKPLSRSNRSMSSTQSPPDRSGKSPPEPSGCRASPGRQRPTCRWIAPPRPQPVGRYKGSPASDVNPWLDKSPHTGNRAAPVPASRTPLGPNQKCHSSAHAGFAGASHP